MRSDYLFARPSFLEGLARLFDFSGSLNQYNESRNGAAADRRAIANDWRIVGADMWQAIETFEQEAAEELAAYDARVKALETPDAAPLA